MVLQRLTSGALAGMRTCRKPGLTALGLCPVILFLMALLESWDYGTVSHTSTLSSRPSSDHDDSALETEPRETAWQPRGCRQRVCTYNDRCKQQADQDEGAQRQVPSTGMAHPCLQHEVDLSEPFGKSHTQPALRCAIRTSAAATSCEKAESSSSHLVSQKHCGRRPRHSRWDNILIGRFPFSNGRGLAFHGRRGLRSWYRGLDWDQTSWLEFYETVICH